MLKKNYKTVLLYSGGMDSWLINKLIKPDVKLFFDIGTEQSNQEKERLDKDVLIKKIDLVEYVQDDSILTIPLRNLIFLSIAVNYGDTIILGTTADDVHYDKKLEFITEAEKLFNSVLTKEKISKQIKIEIPFQDKTKKEILGMYLDKGGNIKDAYDNSFSCHYPKKKKECKKCLPCERKLETFKFYGYEI